MNDYAKARELLGVQTPATNFDDQFIWNYWESLIGDCQHKTGLSPARSGPIFMAHTWRQALGYSFLDVDQDVLAAEQSPRPYQAVKGRLDGEIIRRTLTDQVDEELRRESYRGVTYYSWCKDDVAGCGKGGTVRELTRPRRLAIRDQTLLWAPWTDGIRGMIDAALNETRSLADSGDYRLLARGLDSLNTYTAFFSSHTQGYNRLEDDFANSFPIPENPREYYRQLLSDPPRLLPYTAFATGLGKDRDGFYLVVALAHQSEKTARRNVARLQERLENGISLTDEMPWADKFSRSQIRHEGRLVLTKLYFKQTALVDDGYGNSSIGLWQSFFWRADPLLLHE